MSKIGEKILKRKSGACTTEELSDWLLESICEWTEEEKAEARAQLLLSLPCDGMIQ